jgi:SAM-dependent methyltransferase
MNEPSAPAKTEALFDQYAAAYDEALQRGLAVSGEDKGYFARGRLVWLKRCLAGLGVSPRRVLDFGCGTGSATPFFLELLDPDELLGADVSEGCLEVARSTHGSARARFERLTEAAPRAAFDLAFCNGVFHHIPPPERDAAVGYVFRALRPGALFACWENNPWNPGTRYIMSRVPFDRDAILLRPSEARALLERGGFEVLRTDFLFIFPRWLKWLRWLECPLARWPLGGQYQVLARRPGDS